ncbi:MAG: nucleoside-diphosphate kinase [Thermoplasmata archaeon]
MAEGELERTLVLIKPDGVERGLVGEILGRFERKGLKLLAFNLRQVPTDLAERHYAEHAGKPFYSGLVAHITSGPLVAMALEGRSAISVVRLMIGATNPQAAAPGTIRGDLASALVPNLVHASDSPTSAKRELELFFPDHAFHEYARTDAKFV